MVRGEILKAELMIQKCFRMMDTPASKERDSYIVLINRLAYIYDLKNEYRKVIEVLSPSADLLAKINPNHIDLIWDEYNMGEAYYSLHLYDSAETKYKKALAGRLQPVSEVPLKI